MKKFLTVAAHPLIIAAGVAVLFLVSTLLTYWTTISSGLLYDDSYITLRYASHLATGDGLTFNGYERINSASSTLYTLILAAAYRIGLHDLERVSIAIGLLCGAATLALISLSIRRISGSAFVSLLLPLPLAVCGALAGWSVSGMETPLYCALLSGFVYALLCNHTKAVVLLMALCLLTRPEAVLIPAVLVPVLLFNRRWRAAGAVASVAALVFGSWLAFNYLYYGEVLPHPVAFKAVANYYQRPFDERCAFVGAFFLRFFWFGVLAIIGAGVALWNKRGVAAQWLVVFCLLSGASFVAGPYSDLQRYCVPALPLLAILAAFVWLWRVSVPIRAAIIVTAAWLAYGQSQLDSSLTRQFFAETGKTQQARRTIGQYINAHVPTDAVILSSDIGAIAYAAPRHDFLDMGGLTSSMPVRAVEAGDWGICLDWVKTHRPLYVADTRPVGGDTHGAIQALRIYQYPFEYFKTSYPAPAPLLTDDVQAIAVGPRSIVLARLRPISTIPPMAAHSRFYPAPRRDTG